MHTSTFSCLYRSSGQSGCWVTRDTVFSLSDAKVVQINLSLYLKDQHMRLIEKLPTQIIALLA